MADDETQGETEETGGEGGDGEATEETGKETVDWRAKSRSWERTAKKAQKDRAEFEKQLKDREEIDKSAHEKAVEAARQEGEKTAREAADKDRRADRLETAAIRLASKGVKVKDDDGKEVTIQFADPDDAWVYIERMIRRGDLDEDDLFDDKGKVKPEAVIEALRELIDARPHLAANGAGPAKRSKVAGSADGGKGSSGAKELEDRSPEEWLTAIQGRR